MFAIYILICCIIIPFLLAFTKGMSQYAKFNDNGNEEYEVDKFWKSLCDEYDEFIVDVNKCNIIGIFLELCDMWHSLILYVIVKYCGTKILMQQYIWLIIFWLVLPIAIKHGFRYIMYGCIRNHKNKNNIDHFCSLATKN